MTEPVFQSVAARSMEEENDTELSKGDRTRIRLLGAAEEVFGEVPYQEASVSEIRRRAGVSQGTFYNYFPSKQAVYAELVRHIGRSLRHEIAESAGGLEDRRDFERAAFEAFFRFLQRHMRIYRIVRQAEFVDRGAFIEYYQQFATGYVEGLTRAMRSGQVRRLNPEILAYALMGIGDFIGMRWILWPENGAVPRKVLDDLMDFIFSGMSSDD